MVFIGIPILPEMPQEIKFFKQERNIIPSNSRNLMSSSKRNGCLFHFHETDVELSQFSDWTVDC